MLGKKFIVCIEYLFKIKVLRKSIVEAEKVQDLQEGHIQSRSGKLKESSMLYLSTRGRELWKMLAESSVLLEMYREDVYRDYKENGYYNEDPGWLLIDENKRYTDVIYDLMKYIEYIYSEEMTLYQIAVQRETADDFFSEFYSDDIDEFLTTQHLIKGLINSAQVVPSLKDNVELKKNLKEQRDRYLEYSDTMFIG